MGEIIVLWRIEELYKVIIHECCHYYEIDKNIRTSYMTNKLVKMYNIFNIENNYDALQESYTELCAIIINSIIYSIEHEKNIITILNDEIKFSLLQVSKILNFFNATSITNLINDKILVSQTTSVISYYIIKLGMLLNIDNIALLWEKQNSIIINDKSDDYINFYFNSIFLLKNYDSIFKNIIETIKKDTCDCFVEKTLRMSLHEI